MNLLKIYSILSAIIISQLLVAIDAQSQCLTITNLKGCLEKMAPITDTVSHYFWRYLPPDYDESPSTKKYPLIIFLHGAGKRASNNDGVEMNEVLTEGLPLEIKNGNDLCFRVKGVEECFIVFAPQLDDGPTGNNHVWGKLPADLVAYAINKNYKVDLTKIYITGLSMGGRGTILYAQQDIQPLWPHIDKIAAIAVAPGGAGNNSKACLLPTRDIPMWAAHRYQDSVGGAEYYKMKSFVDAVIACTPTNPYAFFSVRPQPPEHDIWGVFYRTNHSEYFPNVYEWFLLNPDNVTAITSPFGPGAFAGSNKTISLPTNSVTLSGSGHDNDGGPVTYVWTKQDGPTGATIVSPTSASTVVNNLVAGNYVFKLTVKDDELMTQYDLVKVTVNSSGNNPPVANAGPDKIITLPTNSVNLAGSATDSDGTITVQWTKDSGPSTGTIQTPTSANTNVTNLVAGIYIFRLTVKDDDLAEDYDRMMLTVNPAPGCPESGTITREYWSGISGNSTSSIPVESAPTSITELTIFQGPSNVGTNYGSRIRGYICAPTTGNYTFWIASNDYSQLWLSTDESPNNKGSVPIAYVNGATDPTVWTKFTSQKSQPIPLTAGQQYYIEALHKQGAGTDHIAVGWTLPNGTDERPIPGNRLIPFQTSVNNSPTVSITSPASGQSFSAPASFTIAANASDSDGSIAKVEFYNGTQKLGEDLTTPYTFSWNNVIAGKYLVTAIATDNESEKKTSAGVTIFVTGKITRDYWSGISGNLVSYIPQSQTPTSTSQLTIFEGPTNTETNYGTRIRGYVVAPTTGNYIFWIASNDHSELRLSTNEEPLNKGDAIASVTGATNVREWTKYPSQKSVAKTLTAGQRYYIEALHKQGMGSANIAVGWTLPSGTEEKPIPGVRLMPYEASANSAPVASISSPSDGQTFSAPASLTITADAADSDGSIAKVEFFNGAEKLGEDLTDPYSYTWENVSTNPYQLSAQVIDNELVGMTSAPVDIFVTGEITRDYWDGVSGNEVALIPVGQTPTSTTALTIFEGPTDVDTNYGSRIRGYILAPATGDYTFWIASNDHSQLWISTDQDPANLGASPIASITGATLPREWTKYPSQASGPVALTAGQLYYIEALHKQGVGTDNIAVGWTLPGGTDERPIPGIRLMPFVGSGGSSARTTSGTSGDYKSTVNTAPAEPGEIEQLNENVLQLYPNPAQNAIHLTGMGSQADIKMYNSQGLLLINKNVSTDGGNMDLETETLQPGIYYVVIKTDQQLYRYRLIKK